MARSAIAGDHRIVSTHGNAVVSLAVVVVVCLCTQKQGPPKHEVVYETPDDVAVLPTKY